MRGERKKENFTIRKNLSEIYDGGGREEREEGRGGKEKGKT